MERLQEIIERTEINFPRSLNLEETKVLLGFLATSLNCRVNYQFNSFGVVDAIIKEGDTIFREEYPAEFNGSISSAERRASFKLIRDLSDGEILGYNALKFNTIPGYDISEHHPTEVQTWDDVKKQIENYFSR